MRAGLRVRDGVRFRVISWHREVRLQCSSPLLDRLVLGLGQICYLDDKREFGRAVCLCVRAVSRVRDRRGERRYQG